MTPADRELLQALIREQTRGSPSVWRSAEVHYEDRAMSPLALQVMKNEKERQSGSLSRAQSGKKRR